MITLIAAFLPIHIIRKEKMNVQTKTKIHNEKPRATVDERRMGEGENGEKDLQS